MNAKDYWEVFLETGAPEMYLLYNKVRKMEASDAPYSFGISPESYNLQ